MQFNYKSLRYPLFYKKLDLSSQYVLEVNFQFYSKLNHKQRKLFNHRILKFMEVHQFFGKEGVWVDDKMKLLIAGTATMLSFGFDHYLYNIFDKILIYPRDFYSVLNQHQHKGETNPKMGVIAFSWQDFKEGIKIADDNLHLGLHEFAHALHFSFLSGKHPESYRFLEKFRQILQYIEDKTVQEELIKTGYVREYAFKNQFEFFAVLVEHFYESAPVFKHNHPQLFYMMGNLLQIKAIMS